MNTEEARVNNQNRWQVAATLRRRLLEKYNYACAACGERNEDVRLELAHLVAFSSGGDTTEDNLIILCPNCHQTFDRQPLEIEFVSFLTELLKHHQDYGEVNQDIVLGKETRFRGDILAKRRLTNGSETLLIECKTSRVLSSVRIQGVVEQLKTYGKICGDCRLVFAIPATLRERDLSMFRDANIEVWDLPTLANKFTEQIHKVTSIYYKALFLSRLARPLELSPQQKLLDAFLLCRPGKADWQVYQSLVGDTLECLFTPPLSKPIPELSDKALANRRDFIMPNYAEKGFWAFLREKYQADYIVIDAKNHARKIKKSEVLQLANYLKPHGAGLFGLIISREGGDASGCEHTLREQWMVHRKLIIVLNDDDIQAMLIAKSEGREPEEILGQKIEQFRLSM